MGERDENDAGGGAERWNYEDVPRKVDALGATAFSYDDAAHFAFLADVAYEKSKDVFTEVAKNLGTATSSISTHTGRSVTVWRAIRTSCSRFEGRTS